MPPGNKPTSDASTTRVGHNLISAAEGSISSFGLQGNWKACAVLSVLESLFRVPCLCECLLGAQIDTTCNKAQRDAIHHLQLLFDTRAKAVKEANIPADTFVAALFAAQKSTLNMDSFDDEDPAHLYMLISQLIVTSLPELRGIFDRVDKVSNGSSKSTNGISITLSPEINVVLETEIQNKKLPRPKLLESAPVFVVTTQYGKTKKGGAGGQKKAEVSSYSLSFPMSLNLTKLTSSTEQLEPMDLIYQLHSVIAEYPATISSSTSDSGDSTRVIKSFYRNGADLHSWCETGSRPVSVPYDTVRNLGNASMGSHCCVRALIYIQSDLSLMTASGHLPTRITGAKLFADGSIQGGVLGIMTKGSTQIAHVDINTIHPSDKDRHISHTAKSKIVSTKNIVKQGSISGSSTASTSKLTITDGSIGSGSGGSGCVPMEEEVDEDEDDDDDDDEDEEDDYEYGSDDDEEDEEEDDDDDDEDDEEDEEEDDEDDDYENEQGASECQCPTCRRERDRRIRDAARLRAEKETQEKLKQEKYRRLMTPTTPGTKSVAFQPTTVVNGERITIDGKMTVRDVILHTMTAMEGYSNKSQEELRFEDYYLNSPSLTLVKEGMDAEMIDRGKEAANLVAMDREERFMKTWNIASERAWAKFQVALKHYNDGMTEQAVEMFTLALRICHRGPHSAGCYYHRARCVFPQDMTAACVDLEHCISVDPHHPQAHYVLGWVYLIDHKNEKNNSNNNNNNNNNNDQPTITVDFEKAEMHLEKAFLLDPLSFQQQSTVTSKSGGRGGSSGSLPSMDDCPRMPLLERAREQATRQRLINAAEMKKTNGNAALARGAFTEAERLYSEAIELVPEGEKSHIYYCNRAAARCEIGSRLDPTPDVGYRTLQTAIADCDRSLELHPGYTKALFRRWFCMGSAAFMMSEFTTSVSHFSAALDLDPTNVIVKQELHKAKTAVEVIKAKERTKEIEKEMAERELLRADEREREKKALEEKKIRDEMIRKEKAEKAELERLERLRLKEEKAKLLKEKGKEMEEEEEKKKEEKRLEKEKERLTREQEKAEERERKRLEREREKQRAKEEKEKKEKEDEEKAEAAREKKRLFDLEMSRVKAVISAPSAVSTTPGLPGTIAAIVQSGVGSNTPAMISPSSTSVSSGATAVASTSLLPTSTTESYSSSTGGNTTTAISTTTGSALTPASSATTTSSIPSSIGTKKPISGSSSVSSLLTSIGIPIPNATAAAAAKQHHSTTSTSTTTTSTAHDTSPAQPLPGGASAPTIPAAPASPPTTLIAASKALLTACSVSGPIITRTVEISHTKVGIVIGTKGSIIGEMMKKTGTKIIINQDGLPEGQPRDIVFTGTKEQIEAAKVLAQAVVNNGPTIMTSVDLINQATAVALATATAGSSTTSTGRSGLGTTVKGSSSLHPPHPPSHHLGPTSTITSSTGLPSHPHHLQDPASAYHWDEVEAESLCVICAEPFREQERISAFGSCNHKGPCSICTVRMRAITGDYSCALCRQEMKCVICTVKDAPFRSFQVPGNPSPDLFYHSKSRMFIPRQHFATVIAPLFEYKCKHCHAIFEDGDMLRTHYESRHGLTLCTLCLHYKQAFPSEQMIYTVADYDKHIREGGSDGSEGHPDCAFCQIRFYDKTELYKHVTKDHHTCHLCSREGAQFKYYKDQKMLDDHFRKEHFTCDETECKEKRVVFKSLFDLQAHKRQVHSGQTLPGGGSSGDVHGMVSSTTSRTPANTSATRGLEEFPSLGGPSHAQSAVSIRRRTGGPPTSGTDSFPILGEGGGGGGSALPKSGPAPGLGLGPAAKGPGPGGASTGPNLRSSTPLSMLSALTNGLNGPHGASNLSDVSSVYPTSATTTTEDVSNTYGKNDNNTTGMTHMEMVRAALKDGGNSKNNNLLDSTNATLNSTNVYQRSPSSGKLSELAMTLDVDADTLALSAMAGEFRPIQIPPAPGLAPGQGLATGTGLSSSGTTGVPSNPSSSLLPNNNNNNNNNGLSPMNQSNLQSNLPDYLQPTGNNNNNHHRLQLNQSSPLNNNSNTNSSHHDQLLLSSLLSGSSPLNSGLNISPTGAASQSLSLTPDGRLSTSSHNFSTTNNNLHGGTTSSSSLDGLTSLLQGLNNGLNGGLNNSLNQPSLLSSMNNNNNNNNNQTNNNFSLASLRQSFSGGSTGTYGSGVNDGGSPSHGSHNIYHSSDTNNNALSMGGLGGMVGLGSVGSMTGQLGTTSMNNSLGSAFGPAPGLTQGLGQGLGSGLGPGQGLGQGFGGSSYSHLLGGSTLSSSTKGLPSALDAAMNNNNNNNLSQTSFLFPDTHSNQGLGSGLGQGSNVFGLGGMNVSDNNNNNNNNNLTNHLQSQSSVGFVHNANTSTHSAGTAHGTLSAHGSGLGQGLGQHTQSGLRGMSSLLHSNEIGTGLGQGLGSGLSHGLGVDHFDDDEYMHNDMNDHLKMITDDDDDQASVELTLDAYRSGKLTTDHVAELCRQACENYRLDAVCCSCFMDASVETRIAVLASLTSVPPGVRNNDNNFVKTSFANLSRFPTASASTNAHLPPPPTTTTTGSHQGHGMHTHATSTGPMKERDHGTTKSVHSGHTGSAQGQGVGQKGSGMTTHRSPPTSPIRDVHPSNDHDSMDDGGDMMADDDTAYAVAASERALFPVEFIDKLIAVLRFAGADGLLGSQFPDVYRKLHGEKLVLENSRGRKLKLLHVLDGHPNVRKEKLGTYKWFYREGPTEGGSASGGAVHGIPIGSTKGSKATESKANTTTKTTKATSSTHIPLPASVPPVVTKHSKDKGYATAGGGVTPSHSPKETTEKKYAGPPGIEVDLLPADSFPSVAWLRSHDMHMYRWAGNAKEWTEYALRLRPEVAGILESSLGETLIATLKRQSNGCVITMGSDMLNGKTEHFLVFVRGDSGHPSNAAMTLALELFSQLVQTNDTLRDAVMGGGGGGGGGRTNPSVSSFGSTGGTGGTGGGHAPYHHPSTTSGSTRSNPPPPSLSTTVSTTTMGRNDEFDDKSDVDGTEETSPHHLNHDTDADIASAEDAAMEDIHGEGRIQRVLELPQSAVSLIAGKAGKKLYAMRRKSGAYVALVNKPKGAKGGAAKLTISGSVAAVEMALHLVKLALSEYDPNNKDN